MSEPYVGEIRMFAGNFAPRGWAFCDGQLLAVSQNDALFSLFGTIYGGDGRTTFGLPDLRGRIPVHAGTGPGLSPVRLGAKGGVENVTLTTQEIPHSHTVKAYSSPGSTSSPINTFLGATGEDYYDVDKSNHTTLSSKSISYTGGNQSGGTESHMNVMPFLCVNFIVALVGIYPSRS